MKIAWKDSISRRCSWGRLGTAAYFEQCEGGGAGEGEEERG